eukprot:scaffold45886_cov49-Phaeocystis_antarctica.AAC.3
MPQSCACPWKAGGSVPSGGRLGARRVRWLRRRGGRGDAAAVLSDGRAGRAGSSAWPYVEGGGGSSGGGWVREEVHLDRSRESKPHAPLGASGAGGTGRGRTEWSPPSNGLQCSCRSIVAFCACTAAASPSACAKKASTWAKCEVRGARGRGGEGLRARVGSSLLTRKRDCRPGTNVFLRARVTVGVVVVVVVGIVVGGDACAAAPSSWLGTASSCRIATSRAACTPGASRALAAGGAAESPCTASSASQCGRSSVTHVSPCTAPLRRLAVCWAAATLGGCKGAAVASALMASAVGVWGAGEPSVAAGGVLRGGELRGGVRRGVGATGGGSCGKTSGVHSRPSAASCASSATSPSSGSPPLHKCNDTTAGAARATGPNASHSSCSEPAACSPPSAAAATAASASPEACALSKARRCCGSQRGDSSLLTASAHPGASAAAPRTSPLLPPRMPRIRTRACAYQGSCPVVAVAAAAAAAAGPSLAALVSALASVSASALAATTAASASAGASAVAAAADASASAAAGEGEREGEGKAGSSASQPQLSSTTAKRANSSAPAPLRHVRGQLSCQAEETPCTTTWCSVSG